MTDEYKKGYADALADVPVTSADYAALQAELADMRAGFQLELASKDARIKEMEKEVHDLQVALAFWLPGVPMTGPQDVVTRLSDDAMLLAGLDAAMKPDAEDLGWITLNSTL